jgi:hypothetical protein
MCAEALMKIIRKATAENQIVLPNPRFCFSIPRFENKLFAIFGAGALDVQACALIFDKIATISTSPTWLFLSIPFTYATILQVATVAGLDCSIMQQSIIRGILFHNEHNLHRLEYFLFRDSVPEPCPFLSSENFT